MNRIISGWAKTRERVESVTWCPLKGNRKNRWWRERIRSSSTMVKDRRYEWLRLRYSWVRKRRCFKFRRLASLQFQNTHWTRLILQRSVSCLQISLTLNPIKQILGLLIACASSAGLMRRKSLLVLVRLTKISGSAAYRLSWGWNKSE